MMCYAFLGSSSSVYNYLLRRRRSLFSLNESLGNMEGSSAVTVVVGRRVLAKGDDIMLLRCLDSRVMLKLNGESDVGVGVSRENMLPLLVLLLEFVRANDGCG